MSGLTYQDVVQCVFQGRSKATVGDARATIDLLQSEGFVGGDGLAPLPPGADRRAAHRVLSAVLAAHNGVRACCAQPTPVPSAPAAPLIARTEAVAAGVSAPEESATPADAPDPDPTPAHGSSMLPPVGEAAPLAPTDGEAAVATQRISALERVLAEQAATETALRNELVALRATSEQQRVQLDRLLVDARRRVAELEGAVETLRRERNAARSQAGRLQAELRQAEDASSALAAELEVRESARGARLDQVQRHLAAASALMADARPATALPADEPTAVGEAAPTAPAGKRAGLVSAVNWRWYRVRQTRSSATRTVPCVPHPPYMLSCSGVAVVQLLASTTRTRTLTLY